MEEVPLQVPLLAQVNQEMVRVQVCHASATIASMSGQPDSPANRHVDS